MRSLRRLRSLLEVSCYGSATTNCFPAFDGNGNVAALIHAADGTVAVNDEYAAFGEPVRVTGVMARNNPFRFSTKYADDESDLLYYGYRYYKPSTGTWLSRDPIGQKGGLNLYGFVYNNPSSWFDSFGLCCGSFIIREKLNIKVPDYQLPGSGGKEYLDGFEVQYTPCNPCECPKDKIKLVQAIKSDGGTGEGPHMDASTNQRHSNRDGSDTSLPSYSGYSGDDGPLSYIDAPNNPRKFYGETTFTMEVCAVCKNGKDTVLGCTTFTFGDVKRKPNVPGGKAREKGDGVEIGCSDPGQLWKDAVKDWNDIRLH